MKGGLCFIYTSLLTVSLISSCALFMLVVSEALQEVESAADLSGLHNVSQKVRTVSDSEGDEVARTTTVPLPKNEDTSEEAPTLGDQEMTFAEALSLNSVTVTTEGLPDTGQPPILISLGDSAKLDLNPDELLYANESEQHNDTKAFSLVDTDEKRETIETHTVFKAKPMHEARLEDVTQTTPLPPDETESQEEPKELEPAPVKPVTPHEDIPSFSEWAQKQLAEAEKKDTVLNHSSQPSHSNTNFSSKNNKVRSKNYASPACGAKVVAVNPEAGSPSSILSPNRDEYMLNTCNSRIWFVIELCEAVQAQKIEIANFELFSSTPKEFAVFSSDRFPTREWASVGQFTANDMRDVQSFDLFPHLFGKFIKVEMISHHGSEHYCPISLFKVYGTSEFEVLEKENAQHAAHVEDEDDEIIDVPNIPAAEAEPSKNLFGSARDAVMSIMKKAAQALVKTEVPKNVSSAQNDSSTDKMYKQCCSPSHIVVCDNCSETLYNEVYELISCDSERLFELVRLAFLRDTLKSTDICLSFGLDFKSTKTIEFSTERVAYVNALFPQKYIAALCNILAIIEKKVVLNTSFVESNGTTNETVEETPQKDTPVNHSAQDVKLVPDIGNKSDEPNYILQTEPPVEATTEKTVPLDILEEESNILEKNKETQSTIDEYHVQEPTDPKTLSENEKNPETAIETEYKDSSQKTEPRNGKMEAIEKAKDPNVEESEIMIDGDSFMSDLDQMAIDPTPAGTQATPNQNQGTMIQKESVFLRLSNRVKTLERNMSLSGQYLEELSRRYKKQVEEMQKTFEKTIQQMTEERKKSIDREQKYLEQMTSLQDQLSHMAQALTMLMNEHDSWFGNITFFKFIVFQSLIVGAVFYYITKKRKVEQIMVPIPKRTKKKEKLRRKSVEGVSGHATPSAKKRRPSEEALQIARQSAEEMSRDEDDGGWQVARKNRRRKVSIIHRNPGRAEWGRQDSIGALQENPIPLDEEEFIAPVSEPALFNGVHVDVEPPKQEPPKTNGFFNNLKNRTMKTRRLSSPAFLRTLSRQSTRNSPSPVVRTLEPIFNGNINGNRKAASESPTGSLWSESTEVSQIGTESFSGGGKRKKSFKNMLKKVF